jgi:flagellar assembly protein FliH
MRMSLSRTKILRPADVRRVERPSAAPSFTGLLDGDGRGSPRGGSASEGERLRREFEERLRRSALESYEEGLREGKRLGREEELAESRRSLDALAALLEDLSSLKRRILEEAEPDVLEMIFAVAGKVLHREVERRPDAVVPVLQAAMRSVQDRDGIKIRLHPLDYQHLLEIREDFFRRTDGLKNVVFEQDESLLRGGVFVETRFGDVDARLDRQLEEVRTQVLRGKPAPPAPEDPEERAPGKGRRGP